MPDIALQHIVSCSSEDPSFPAKNLINSSRKWRTKKDGDSSATVVIQLEKETKINKIDIGNNGSAFVEVLVGKSSAPEKDYEVLLLNSSFMTPSESRGGTDMTRVRMFDLDKLCQDTAKQKWDRIKIVCQQKFNLHAQFGLSFIKLQAPAESSPGSSALGRFLIRDEEEDNIMPGSLFARRKDISLDSPSQAKTVNAAISEASSSPGTNGRTKAAVIIPKKREHSLNGSTPESKKRMLQPPSSSASAAASPTERVGKIRKKLERGSDEEDEDDVKVVDLEKSPVAKPKDKKSPARTKEKEKPKEKKKAEAPSKPEPTPGIKVAKQKLPYDQLLKGVTFVLSGFQNPMRGILRDNALDMGAKYKGDWDKTCTHLIGAFANTPKVKQVKAMGNGKIVTKEWIDQCYRKRKRFPWRRFALEKADQDESESEEEIWEDTNDTAGPSSSAQPTADPVIVSDEDEPLSPERVKIDANGKDDDDAIYDAETDNDSDGVEVAKWPKLPHFFEGLIFTLHEDLDNESKKKLKRYIIAAKGKVVENLSEEVKFLVTESNEGIEELAQFYPDTKAVLPKWVWECFNNEKLMAFDKFLLKI